MILKKIRFVPKPRCLNARFLVLLLAWHVNKSFATNTDSLKLAKLADSVVQVFENQGLSPGEINTVYTEQAYRFDEQSKAYLEVEKQILLATSCYEHSQIDLATKLANDVLKTSKAIAYRAGIGSAHQLLAWLRKTEGDDAKSMAYADSVYTFYHTYYPDTFLIAPLITKAMVDTNQKSAIAYLKTAAKIGKTNKKLSSLSSIYHNLAFEYFQSSNTDSAAVYVKLSRLVADQIATDKTLAYQFWLEAMLARRLGDNDAAEANFNSTLQHLADSSEAVGLSAFNGLILLSTQRQDYKTAFNLLYKRSLFKDINVEKELENRQELYQEMRRLDEANHQKSVLVEQMHFEQNRLRIIAIAGAAVLGLLFLVVFLQVRNKQKLEQINRTITLNKLQIEEKNRELTDSIKYAQKIQNSLLPKEEKTKALLKDHFILFLPRDIVSGDFYWLGESSAGTYFAVADCTGHGVPGALVSSVCYHSLNKSLQENLQEPAQILSRTRELVVDEFDDADEAVSDGMDIAMCLIKGDEIEFAGAYNPLIIIRDNEIIELKADKQPVGKFETYKPFTNQRFNLKKGDVIYAFSDGFADQFGGEKGKKFKSSRFKALLLSLHQLPMEEQKISLQKTFEEWKHGYDQVDDICVLGWRVE